MFLQRRGPAFPELSDDVLQLVLSFLRLTPVSSVRYTSRRLAFAWLGVLARRGHIHCSVRYPRGVVRITVATASNIWGWRTTLHATLCGLRALVTFEGLVLHFISIPSADSWGYQLVFEGCRFLNTLQWETLPHLQSVVLKRCRDLSDDALHSLLAPQAVTLLHLAIIGDCGPGDGNAFVFCSLATRLHTVSLRECCGVTNHAVFNIVQTPFLQRLSLVACYKLDDFCSFPLASRHRTLWYLNPANQPHTACTALEHQFAHCDAFRVQQDY